jgi:hypothetical protein
MIKPANKTKVRIVIIFAMLIPIFLAISLWSESTPADPAGVYFHFDSGVEFAPQLGWVCLAKQGTLLHRHLFDTRDHAVHIAMLRAGTKGGRCFHGYYAAPQALLAGSNTYDYPVLHHYRFFIQSS